MTAQAQAKQAQATSVDRSQVSRAATAKRKNAQREVNRKTTNAAPAYLQAKLNVSTPDDPHEREADQIAENVMRMPAQRSTGGVSRQAERADRKSETVARTVDRESLKPGITSRVKESVSRLISRDTLKPGDELIHRASLKPGEDAIQRKEESAAPADTSSVEARIDAKLGQGERLPDGVLSDMETRFGRDFSAVRIHTDNDAADMSRDIEARAFTVGNSIFFGAGQFDANSDDGKRLLAHELTHVAQQQHAPETGEQDGQQVSRADTKAQRWGWGIGEWIANKAWDVLKRVAPSYVYNFVKDVYNKGIIGYIKDKISSAVGSIFNGLKKGADVLSGFFASFSAMAKTTKDIVKALAAGDCKPLFAAVKRLKDTISDAAGDAWGAIKEFFAPIGAFFTDLWQSWGAPVLDWLKKTAGETWDWLKNLGKTIWSWTEPVRDYASSAWNWLKGKIGLGGGSEGGSEGGVMSWITKKASAAWTEVKQVMDPVLKPVKKFAGKVMDVIPIKAILNLRETVQGWLKSAESMGQAMGDDGSDVADQQIGLRETILPAVLKTMKSVRDSLTSAGLWLGDKIGGVVSDFSGFMSTLRENALLKVVAPLLSWIENGVASLGDWAKDTVLVLFTLLGDGLVKVSEFIEPVLNALQQVADTILNLLTMLPKLILGKIWNAIPKCIRDPLKDFVLNQILGRIPFFKQLLAVEDAWEKIKATGLLILKQVFVDGDLLGALWTLFKAILGIFNLPAKLIANIIVKAAQSLGAIIAAPLDFLINILGAIKLGFSSFFSNILTHLLNGAMEWLFGAVAKSGLSIPEDFSLKSVFTFVMDVLGLTMDLVWKKLSEKIGEKKVAKLKSMIAYASGALEWIKTAVTEGPAGLWSALKERLSDLWEVMLDGVIGWINEKVIAWASRWLLSLLDVTGIMPIINATIAVYNAIESFMEHLKEMLEIVNSVLNGVADLAAGAIESAAKFLENALVAAIPIVIGFLANQAGLGNIADKIAEILARIRCKVENAIGAIIDAVIDTINAFVGTVKAGVQAVKEWWKARKDFKTKDGGAHHLHYKGEQSSAVLMVASDTPHTIASIAQNKVWNGAAITETDSGTITAELAKANSAQNALKKDHKDNKAKADQQAALAAIATILKTYTLAAAPKQDIHYPTGVAGDPVLINWYKKASDYTAIKVGGKSYAFDGGINQIELCKKQLGVDIGKNMKNEQSPAWPKSSDDNRTESSSLRGCLQSQNASVENLDKNAEDLDIGTPDNPDNYQIDHVRDLNMGGPDAETNLWPIRSKKNAQANNTQSQWVCFNNGPKQVRNLPNGTRVRVIEAVAAGTPQKTSKEKPLGSQPAAGTGKHSCNGIGTSEVPIVWYKTPADYASITLTTPKKGKPGEQETQTYRIGEEVDLTGVKRKLKPLMVDSQHCNPVGKSWPIKSSNSREISNLVSANLRNYYNNYKNSTGKREAQVKETDGTALTPRNLKKETQIDHVFDLSLGGKDEVNNLWPLRGDKNISAAKNGTQYVAYMYKKKKTIGIAAKLPNNLIVKVNALSGASTQAEPSAYKVLQAIARRNSTTSDASK